MNEQNEFLALADQIEREGVKVYGVWHPEATVQSMIVAALRAVKCVNAHEGLVKALETALRQWQMYADMSECDGLVLAEEKTPEGDLFRQCRAALASLSEGK